jgi:hypothetical protein
MNDMKIFIFILMFIIFILIFIILFLKLKRNIFTQIHLQIKFKIFKSQWTLKFIKTKKISKFNWNKRGLAVKGYQNNLKPEELIKPFLLIESSWCYRWRFELFNFYNACKFCLSFIEYIPYCQSRLWDFGCHMQVIILVPHFFISHIKIYNMNEELKIILSIVRIPLITFNSSNKFYYQNHKSLTLF